MAATVEISTILSGIQQTISGLQSVGTAAVKVGTDTAQAAQRSTTIIVAQQQKQQEAIGKTTASMGNMRQAWSAAAATFSGTSALLSLFAKNNEDLKRQLEQVSIATAAAAVSVRALGAAYRFTAAAAAALGAAAAATAATFGPWGIAIAAATAAVVAGIAVWTHWDTIQKTVVASAMKLWTALGEFFGRLFGSISNMAQGLGQILFGALTFNWSRITAGVEQLKLGLGEMGQLAIDTGKQLAAGFQSALGSVQSFLGGVTKAKEEIKELGKTPLELKLEAFGAAMAKEEQAIADAQRSAADDARRVAGEILAAHEAAENAKVDLVVGRIQQQTEAERQRAAEVAAIGAAEVANIGLLQQQIGQQVLAQTQQSSTAWQALASFAAGAWNQISTNFAAAMAGMIAAGESFQVTMKSITQSFLAEIIKAIIVMLQKWIAAAVSMAVAGAAAHGALKGGFIGLVVESAKAAGATIAAAAAGYAAGLAAAAAFSAQGGMEDVPATATFRLHRGERVLSRRQNVALEEFMAEEGGGRRGGIHVHLHFDSPVTVFDDISLDRAAKRLGPALRRELRLRPSV